MSEIDLGNKKNFNEIGKMSNKAQTPAMSSMLRSSTSFISFSPILDK